MQHQQQQRLLVAMGATTGAVAACVLAHKLWSRHQDAEGLQVWSSSGSSSTAWMPQLLLQRSLSAAASTAGSVEQQQQQAQQEQLPQVVYDYAQSIEELLLEAQLPAHVRQQDVCVKFGPRSLLVVVGQQRVVDGSLAGHILPEHSSWKIEGYGKDRKLSITLAKQPTVAAAGQHKYAVWESLLLLPEGDLPQSPGKRDQGVAQHS